MARWASRGGIVLSTVLALVSAGCLGNPDCNNVIGILTKLGPERNIGSLTACEWQTVFAELPNVSSFLGIDLQGATIPDLTDQQAQEIVDFLSSHHIQTLNELISAFNNGSTSFNDLPPELLSFLNSLE